MRRQVPFEQVVAERGPSVLRVCRALLGGADADDCWSETFLAALEAYPRLPPDANVEAWLVTIAHRKAIDHIRRIARRAVPVAEVPDRDGRPGSAGPVAVGGAGGTGGCARTGVESRDLDLARALGRLPDKQRYAVVHHYLGGLPYAEVAALVGGTEAAARRAAADGIAALRKSRGSISATDSAKD